MTEIEKETVEETMRNPAGPNEMGRMPDGVVGEANIDRVAQDQAEGEERAGHGKQDVAREPPDDRYDLS